MKRTTIALGLLLIAGFLAFSLLRQPAHDRPAASNGATTLNLVKLPASTGGVSVGLTKLAPAHDK